MTTLLAKHCHNVISQAKAKQDVSCQLHMSIIVRHSYEIMQSKEILHYHGSLSSTQRLPAGDVYVRLAARKCKYDVVRQHADLVLLDLTTLQQVDTTLHQSCTTTAAPITAGLGGVGFKSMVMRGAITAGCKTVGDRKAYHRRFSNRW